jgi:prepilin-type N-terminal cleavage/methylation domain-containing protein
MSSGLLKRGPVGGAARRGLTLLELVVVVAILAALAGILVPLLPYIMHRAHAATGATNLTEIAKAIQLFASQNGDNYPNQLDSIVDSSSGSSQIASYVLNTTGALSAGQLNSGDASALGGSGITTVAPMVENPGTTDNNGWSPTFNPYNVASGTIPNMTALSSGASAAFLSPQVAASKFNTTLTGTTTGTGTSATTTYAERFVVFGLGQFATICGNGIDGAPVWYNPTAGQDPDSTYARFGLVFQTANASGALSTAKLVGIVEFAQWGPMTKDDNLSYFYSLK